MSQTWQRHNLVWDDCWFYQSMDGYRVNRDSLVMARSLLNVATPQHRLMPTSPVKQLGVDLGAGVGVLSILFLRDCLATGMLRTDLPKITAVEVQPSLVELLEKNCQENNLSPQIDVVADDWRQIPTRLSPASFDFAICNPPYYPKEAGLLNTNPEKAVARHFIHGDVEDLVAAAAYLLKPSGSFYLIYNYSLRQHLLTGLHKHHLHIKTMRHVVTQAEGEPRLVLLQAVKGAAPLLEFLPPLIYSNGDGANGTEADRLFYAK